MPKAKSADLGREKRKLHPKLRMVANGSSRVNAIRADTSSCLAVEDSGLLEAVRPPPVDQVAPRTKEELSISVNKGKLRVLPDDVLASVFIETSDPSDVTAESLKLSRTSARKGNLVAATVTLAELRTLVEKDSVTHIEFAEPLAMPTPTISPKARKAPPANRWRFGSARQHHLGRGLLMGIIDVQGFDFAHPDFLDAKGQTRFEYIWDQGGTRRPPPGQRGATHFDYGAEFTGAQLNDAIKTAKALGLPAYEVERQSQIVDRSHGTHVASIAAGKHGICPKARLAGVLIALPEGDQDRRTSFYDSTRIVQAVEYLLAVADELHLPISINISLGTNGHAHDASSALSRWIDAALAVPGRSVCAAAGNAGQEVAEFEGDRGYVMGRIHTSGRLPARGLDADIEWLVIGNGMVDVSENELEIWYGAQDRFAVSLRPPGRTAWIGPLEPQEYIENFQLENGSFVSMYNELYHAANGSNLIALYLSPFFNEEAPLGIEAGTWTVRLHGREVRDGRYHGWIERDDPRKRGRSGVKELWSFPSFFSEKSNVDDSSVSSLACGRYVIAVANLDETQGRINVTSSQGPTRDGRYKPELAAPGTDIVAARGFAPAGDPWVGMTGTSMASPYVAGVIGLMLATNPKLTAAQIGGILQRTSRPLPGWSFAWANDAGFGVVDPEACLVEAATINERIDYKPERREARRRTLERGGAVRLQARAARLPRGGGRRRP